MMSAVLASLIVASTANDAYELPAAPPMTEDLLSAHTVNRGLEEPGRYDVANLFDGDIDTSYCSAPGRGQEEVTIHLTPADEALLSNLKAVRVTPSPTSSARSFAAWLYLRDSAGLAGGTVEGTIGPVPTTLPVFKTHPGPGGTILVYLRGDGSRNSHGPLCLAEIAFLGPIGVIELPDLSRAVKAAIKRDAELARLTANRAAFARAYLTSFEWSLLNGRKETSDWESVRYRFFPDGTYEQERFHILVPERSRGRWSVDKLGRRVRLDGAPIELGPCKGREGYLCLGSLRFFPNAAW